MENTFWQRKLSTDGSYIISINTIYYPSFPNYYNDLKIFSKDSLRQAMGRERLLQ